MSEMQVVTGMV